jgi:NAD(P)-dependent dehydrogenase (short-subunit alcohol dehydrogenase family)
LAKIPLKKLGSPESIVQAVLFLLTNDYITGEVIRIDGGRLLSN